MPPNDAGQPTVNLATIETRLRLDAGGRQWLLERTEPPLRFGRAADNDLALGDDFTSRHHGTIGFRDGQFQLTDDSRNGTLVGFDDGVSCRVHHGRCMLDRQGRLRLGHPTSVAIGFVIEIRSTEGGRWVSPVRRDANVIRRESDFWTVCYGGRVLRLKDSKGMQYLSALLRDPGREFHALDLVTPAAGGMETHDSGVLLDSTARAEYRQRLGDLRTQLAEAEAFHDLGAAARLRVEIDALGQELARAVGLGGRARAAGSNAERARVAVTQRIKHAIAQIRRHDAALGHHLASAVQTGLLCSYRPDETMPVSWVP